MRLNLFKKIFFSIEGISLVALILISATSVIFIRNVIKKEVYTRLSSISYLKGDYIKQYIDFHTSSVENTIKSGHINDELVYLLENKDGKSKRLAIEFFLDSLIESSDLVDVSILNKEGLVVASKNKEEEGKIRVNEPYFLNAKNGTYVESFVYDSYHKIIIIIISTPIIDEEGNFIGVFVEKIDTKKINNLLSERSGLGDTGETFLVNSSHVVTSNLLKEKESTLRRTLYLPQINLCLEKNSNYFLSTDYHGDIIYGYARWFPEIDSCIISKIDKKEVEKTFLQIVPQALAIITIITLITLIFGYFISKSIILPIVALKEKANSIKEGDLEVEIEPSSSDEVGELAIAFKEMVIRLKELYKNLEEKVKERTNKLYESEKRLEESLALSEKNNKMMIDRELEMIKLKERISDLEKES